MATVATNEPRHTGVVFAYYCMAMHLPSSDRYRYVPLGKRLPTYLRSIRELRPRDLSYRRTSSTLLINPLTSPPFRFCKHSRCHTSPSVDSNFSYLREASNLVPTLFASSAAILANKSKTGGGGSSSTNMGESVKDTPMSETSFRLSEKKGNQTLEEEGL